MDNRSLKSINPLIVIPARNEAPTIAEVVRGIQDEIGVPVVVVDDNSSDGTVNLAKKAGAITLELIMPLGAWGATQTGIRYAMIKEHGSVITMDADGQHESAYLKEMLEPLLSDTADVVIGAYPQRASPARHLAWALFRRLAGFDLADLTSGFRAYNRKAVEVLASREATLLDYQDIGVLILLRKAGLRIVEVPVQMRPRASGVSRIFNSWWTVSWYLAQTAILCLAHWEPRSRTE